MFANKHYAFGWGEPDGQVTWCKEQEISVDAPLHQVDVSGRTVEEASSSAVL